MAFNQKARMFVQYTELPKGVVGDNWVKFYYEIWQFASSFLSTEAGIKDIL